MKRDRYLGTLALVALAISGCNLVIGDRVPGDERDGSAGGTAGSSANAGAAGVAGSAGTRAAGGSAGDAGNAGVGGSAGTAGTGAVGGAGGAAPTWPVPKIFFTDISHAPVAGGPDGGGAFVTLYGLDLGTTVGRVEFAGAPLTIHTWGTSAYRGLQKIVAQIPAGTPTRAGKLRVVSAGDQQSNELDLTTTQGKIVYARPDGTGDGSTRDTPTNLAGLAGAVAPGCVVYLAGGTYDENLEACFNGERCAWRVELSAAATSNKPIQIVGYPGEDVVFSNPGYGLDIRQDHLRLANLKLHVGQYSAVAIEGARDVFVVANDLWADAKGGAGVEGGGVNPSFEVTGNYIHGFLMGTASDATDGSRLVRFNQFELVDAVLGVSLTHNDDIEDFGNAATNVAHYGFLGACTEPPCSAPSVGPKVQSFNNVVNGARYFVFQFLANSTSADVRFTHNTVGDVQCAVGATDAGVVVQAMLRGNILPPDRAASCTDKDNPVADTVAFDGRTNHWGMTTVPGADPMGVTGVLGLDAESMPSSTSSVCAGIERADPPLDDHLGRARRDLTAFGAFECP